MRIFVVGAEGAVRTRLVAQFIDPGHQVIGTHRSPSDAGRALDLRTEAAALGQPTRAWRRIAASS